MHPLAPRRTVLLTLALALTALLALPACQRPPTMHWRLGRTHGAVLESGAARAGVNIYRKPTRAIHRQLRRNGINAAQNYMWSYGRTLRFSVCFPGLPCIGQGTASRKIKGWIYGDDADLRGAIIDAYEHGDCLSLTLMSHGSYVKNWTHKRVGCREGSMPSPQAAADGQPAPDVPLLPDGAMEPPDPHDHIPADNTWSP
ncbi:MAG: hypothetical protein JWM47_1717 [Acidimicrobiales bacterium]|nr:hypothetical protein [Acidimicrobiales bacterium]